MTTNKFFRSALCCFIAILGATLAFATPSPSTSTDPYIVLPSGTNLSLKLNMDVNADELSAGNALEFQVKGDVRVNNQIVISNGARATGTVTKVKKGCQGKCSEITFVVEEVQAIDGQMVPLNSTPHIVRPACCDGAATASIGTLVRANTLDERYIKN